MKKTYIITAILSILGFTSNIQAQKIGKFFDVAENKATDFGLILDLDSETGEDEVQEENVVEWTCSKCGHVNHGGEVCTECGQKNYTLLLSKWNRYDFVAGDSTIFDDSKITSESELSMWNVLAGSVNFKQDEDGNSINLHGATITPFSTEEQTRLTDQFTCEFDIYLRHEKEWEDEMERDFAGWGLLSADFMGGDDISAKADNKSFEIDIDILTDGDYEDLTNDLTLEYKWMINGEQRMGNFDIENVRYEAWHHVAVVYYKHTTKIYFDEKRVAVINNVRSPKWLMLSTHNKSENLFYIRNTKVAVGAAPLIDRINQDSMITINNIRFEEGSVMFEMQSIGEINRIAKLMKDNANLKLEVACPEDSEESHLCKKRSDMIIAVLAARGIARERLTASSTPSEAGVVFTKR